MTLKSKGILSVEPHKKRISLEVSEDVLNYYNWFISKEYWIILNQPLYGGHITVGLEKYYPNIDWDKAMTYSGTEIEFDYDVNMVRGGYTKGFIMFYLKVFSEGLEKLKKELNMVDDEYYKGLHLTIGSSTKSGNKPRLYWPEMIEIKTRLK